MQITAKPIKLTQGIVGSPRISGDGSTVVWNQIVNDNEEIMRYRDGKVDCLSHDPRPDMHADLSYDGSVVAWTRFSSVDPQDKQGHWDIVMWKDGQETTLASTRANEMDPVVSRDDVTVRAFREDVLAHLGNPLIDVRSPEEYVGDRTTAPAYPEEGTLRAGHIPSAQNVPWAKAVAEDGTFKPVAELDAIYRDGAGLNDGDSVIAYCRIGERSSHTWFVLTHLLGFEGVRNYDGSWTEWGSAVRVPIVKGADAGAVPVL